MDTNDLISLKSEFKVKCLLINVSLQRVTSASWMRARVMTLLNATSSSLAKLALQTYSLTWEQHTVTRLQDYTTTDLRLIPLELQEDVSTAQVRRRFYYHFDRA